MFHKPVREPLKIMFFLNMTITFSNFSRICREHVRMEQTTDVPRSESSLMRFKASRSSRGRSSTRSKEGAATVASSEARSSFLLAYLGRSLNWVSPILNTVITVISDGE